MKRNLQKFTGFPIDQNKFENPQPIMIEQETPSKSQSLISINKFLKNSSYGSTSNINAAHVSRSSNKKSRDFVSSSIESFLRAEHSEDYDIDLWNYLYNVIDF
jgi:hypothetical protein